MFSTNGKITALKKEAYKIIGIDTPGDRRISEEEMRQLTEICAQLAQLSVAEFDIEMLFYAICTAANKANLVVKEAFLKLANNFYCDYLINAVQRCIESNLSGITDLSDEEISHLENITQTISELNMIDGKKEKLASLFAKAAQNAKNNNSIATFQELDIFCRDLDNFNKQTFSEGRGQALYI
jgi:hypothetical protein